MAEAEQLARRGAAVPPEPVASVVIPVLDRVDDLRRCLHSVERMQDAELHEVIVVANGTPEVLLTGLPSPERLVVVPSPVNLGFGGGCNWGTRFSRGRHLVLLNDDTEVEPGWLRALLEAAASDPRIGAAGSLLLDPDGRVQEAGSVLWSDGGTYQVGRGLAADAPGLGRLRDVDYASACGLLVTREAWNAVGGFDERYFPAYHEDVDLCLRIRQSGRRVVVAPAARLRHRRGGSLPEDVRSIVGTRSGRRFRERWGSALEDFEPHPEPGHLGAAVTAALTRAEQRPLPPLRPPTAEPPPPTSAEAAEVRLRARHAAEELSCDVVEALRREVAELRVELSWERARIVRLCRLARRLHLPRMVRHRIFGDPPPGS